MINETEDSFFTRQPLIIKIFYLFLFIFIYFYVFTYLFFTKYIVVSYFRICYIPLIKILYLIMKHKF
jgi:hypothetical protein